MTVISDDSKLVFLALSWISPCSLETPEGIALNQKRKEAQGRCVKCPFSWYCETIAGAVLTAAQDVAELMGLRARTMSKPAREKAEGCRNLVLKAFKEMRKLS